MATKADKIAAEIQTVETDRAALLFRQDAVERALAEPGAPAELAAELVTLGARIKAAAVRLLALSQAKQDAEAAELLATYRQRFGEYYAIEGQLTGLDAELQTHKDALARLTEARRELETQRLLASGRLNRLHREGIAVGLGAEISALHTDMDRARRQPIAS